jgi:hypothetical protein
VGSCVAVAFDCAIFNRIFLHTSTAVSHGTRGDTSPDFGGQELRERAGDLRSLDRSARPAQLVDKELE